MFRPTTVALVLALAAFLPATSQAQNADYGVDCSFPIHSKEWKCGDLLGDRRKLYEDFMQSCRDHYGGVKARRCDITENDRIEMSVRQPRSMVNYTSTGFKKIKAPKKVFDLLKSHWEMNKHLAKEEVWAVGNVYVNHWESPTYMVAVEDSSLRGAGLSLKQHIWDAVKDTIEQWTGMEQEPISMYGIRTYTEGAILSPHVDRLPLVSSCIVNVDQDVDEPWPLEIYDRHDRAVNVTMEPGDMVLYESGSLIHGRPFPLKGRSFSNIFIHFEPTGRKLGDKTNAYLQELDAFFPPYLVPNSPETKDWAAKNPAGWKKSGPSAPIQQVNSPEGHYAAATGDIDLLSKVAQKDRKSLTQADRNGWQPIHEAVRAGHLDIVQYLIEKHGADMNARTGPGGKGMSPLNLAMEHHNEDHPLVSFLRSIGAKDYAQEL